MTDDLTMNRFASPKSGDVLPFIQGPGNSDGSQGVSFQRDAEET